MLPLPIVVFTDLDGTLLDERNYSWGAAEDALDALHRRKVPLIFCTSKTRAEVEFLRRLMGHTHPFITENGGGIFIPHGYFSHRIDGGTGGTRREHCLALGKPYSHVVEALESAAENAGVEIVNFRRMSSKEIAENTGLSIQEAALSQQRDFDEPFYLAGANAEKDRKLLATAKAAGLEITRGGRFWHAHSGSDKGRAVRELMKHFNKGKHSKLRSVGIGNSANDLPMLTAVNQAILLPQADGEFDDEIIQRLPKIRKGEMPGPAGWNQAVLDYLAA
ncbi:MAG: HAD-IIB family hydrolase [Acidobacteria bacterium]|nr:HAD-IIB family hydrolase [Acidobacteriota bacterium]